MLKKRHLKGHIVIKAGKVWYEASTLMCVACCPSTAFFHPTCFLPALGNVSTEIAPRLRTTLVKAMACDYLFWGVLSSGLVEAQHAEAQACRWRWRWWWWCNRSTVSSSAQLLVLLAGEWPRHHPATGQQRCERDGQSEQVL